MPNSIANIGRVLSLLLFFTAIQQQNNGEWRLPFTLRTTPSLTAALITLVIVVGLSIPLVLMTVDAATGKHRSEGGEGFLVVARFSIAIHWDAATVEVA